VLYDFEKKDSLEIKSLAGIRRSDDEIGIPVPVEVDRSGKGEPETSQFGIDVSRQNCLTRELVDSVGASSENVDRSLFVRSTVGRSGGEIVIPVSVEVPEFRQRKAKSGTDLTTVSNVPMSKFVLKKKILHLKPK
jgi:hypothetical protein